MESISSEDEDFPTIENMAKPTSRTLDLRYNYAPHWTPRDAFREIVQNWRDAMVARGLDQDRFEITMAEKTDHGDVEILYTARYEGKSYGYIRYSGTENGGVIDITNRDAQLKIQDLDFGPSGKEMNESQAGRHGEGMKIALVVFMRRPLSHFVTFHASGCKWNFSWRQVSKKLGVKITRMNTVPLQKLVGKSEADFSKGLVPFVVDHSRDVQVQIGVGLRRKDELGRLMRSTPLVSVDNFHEWCQAASWLQPMNDADVVKTDVGSLFLNNSKLCQKFFLRGLLLSEPDSQGNTASLTSKPLKYGYDFRDGYVNRERKNFSRWTEESAKILDIWCEVIRIKPELVKSFCDMLLNSTKYADVHGVQSFLDHIMVNRIWKELRSRQCWYYNQAQKDKDHQLDVTLASLGYRGCELRTPIWELLVKYTDIKTVESKQNERFCKSEVTFAGESDEFAQYFLHMFTACLNCCEHTTDMRVDLVKAGEFLISAKYIREGNKRVLKVHEKCIHREHCIQNLGLSANSTDAYVVSRVVKQLFDSTLDQVLATDDQPEKITEEYKNDKRRVVDEKLQVHRSAQGQIDLIQVFDRVFGNLKKLRLRWPKRFAVSHQLPIIVQLHRTATCSHLLQHRLTDKMKAAVSCLNGRFNESCSQVEVSTVVNAHYDFTDLVIGESYFAIVFDKNDDLLYPFCVPTNLRTHQNQSTATPTTPAVYAANASHYKLGPEITHPSLDLVHDRTWYETTGGAQGAVIGIKSQTSAPATPRSKRQRTAL